jgi:SAM-dependent methyltransferase
MLLVPERFNRNSSTVTSLMPPEQAGIWLLERMRQHIGFESYADKKLLDFGCGVRFSQAIINSQFAIGHYCGVDNFRPLIEFLQDQVRDRRFEYGFLNAYHPLYNEHGKVLSTETALPVADRDFDIISMFSVITHQNPSDSTCIFTALRRHISADGHLFFTCFLDQSIATFEDRSPERNGGRCFYNPSFLTELVELCGWRQVRSAPSEGPLIANSFVYKPV